MTKQFDELRVVKKFLWLPKTINGTTKWLWWCAWEEKKYKTKSAFNIFAMGLSGPFYNEKWIPFKWI